MKGEKRQTESFQKLINDEHKKFTIILLTLHVCVHYFVMCKFNQIIFFLFSLLTHHFFVGFYSFLYSHPTLFSSAFIENLFIH